MKYYIMDAKGNIVATDRDTWAVWFEDFKGRSGADEMIGGCRISTIFLGLDHSWGKGPPTLWETMVFGDPMDQAQDRCSGGKEQAEAMHAAMVERVRAVLAVNQ